MEFIVIDKLEFYVAGTPQSRMRKRSDGKGNRFGGVHDVDTKGGKKKAWAQNVRLFANMLMRGRDIFVGPVRLGVGFRFNKPTSKRSPSFVMPYPIATNYPDYSNMYYYIENILKGVVYEDDRQVVGVLPGDKEWATDDSPEGAYITVVAVSDEEIEARS